MNKVATKSAASKGAEAAIVAEQVVSADDAVPVEAHGANVGQPRHRLSASGPCVPEGNALDRRIYYQAAQRARIFGSLVVITIAAVCAFSALAHQVCPLFSCTLCRSSHSPSRCFLPEVTKCITCPPLTQSLQLTGPHARRRHGQHHFIQHGLESQLASLNDSQV